MDDRRTQGPGVEVASVWGKGAPRRPFPAEEADSLYRTGKDRPPGTAIMIGCEFRAEESTIVCLRESPRYVNGVAVI